MHPDEAERPVEPTIPALSVVMPARNVLPWIDEAVRSILDQSFTDFEFIIGDDASNDGTTERLRAWQARDARIRLVERTGKPLGLVGSANWVAGFARAPLMARMDADDISRADRFALQVAALREHPEVVMVGSLWDGMDVNSREVHGRDRSTLLRDHGQPFMHGAIMWRREVFDRIGGYRSGAEHFEDSDIFRRTAAQGRSVVLPEALYRYRWSPGSSHFDAERQRVETALALGSRWGSSPDPAAVGDETLEQWRAEIDGQRVDPTIFLYTAYRRIWSGRHAGILLRMLRRGRIGFDAATVRMLVWAIAGGLAPSALKIMLRRRMDRRDRAAAARIGDRTVFDWPVSTSSTPRD